VRRFLTKLKNRHAHEEDSFGREIIAGWLTSRCTGEIKVLDVGCGDGRDLIALRAGLPNAQLYGLDIMQGNVDLCLAKGITARISNLEHDQIPFEEEYFDVVIANQVFEHLKNWVWALWQIGMKLKTGGILVVGVPNLASLHNRVLLLLGEQPSCIPPGGMHVRSFTVPGLKSVLEHRGTFSVEEVAGRPFYPFPRAISNVLSGLFPRAAASIFLLCRKRGDPRALTEIESLSRQAEFALR